MAMIRARFVDGFPDYIIYNNGKIYSCYTQRFLKPIPQRNGYLHVTLCAKNKKKQVGVHVLVAESFIGIRKAGYVTNHKNGNKQDNRAENLEWVTIRENVNHAYQNNLRTIDQKHRDRCAALGRARRSYSEETAHDVQDLYSGKRGEKIGLARMFGLSRYAISSILGGK